MRDALLWLNVAMLGVIAGLLVWFTVAMRQGYSLSLYRPD